MRRAVIAVLAVALAGVGSTAAQSAPSREPSIWDGVYSEVQAERGARVYPSICGKCHGHLLNGAPDDPDMFSTSPIAGPKFLRDWDGVSLAVLLSYTRETMPANNPGFLTDDEYADLLAYMLSVSGVPAGQTELSPEPDRLSGVVIRLRR